ncbi:MAG: acyl-CoA mutase large subunit family protein [candidate division Zixibacteria bacterium]
MFEEFENPEFEKWQAEAERLIGDKYAGLLSESYKSEGLKLKPLFRQEDNKNILGIESLPGQSPFLRGAKTPTEKRNEWLISQESKCPTPEILNQILKDEIRHGATSLNIPMDRPSRLGFDPDETDIESVGREGVSLTTLDDSCAALSEIDISSYPIYLHVGINGLLHLAYLMALAKKNNIPSENVRGAIASDPIGEWLLQGTLPLPIENAFDELAAVTNWVDFQSSDLGTIWIHGEYIRNSGGTVMMELAYSMAAGVEYLRQMENRDIDISRVLPHIKFSFGIGSNLFLEVAKLRAVRLLWDKITDACGIPPDKRKIRIHATTVDYNKTRLDAYNNVLRLTTESFAGAIGGADSINVSPYNMYENSSDNDSRRLSRNIQLILKNEIHLDKIIDPGGGSYFIEHLTNNIARIVWEKFREIEKQGGLIESLKAGTLQVEIEKIEKKDASDFLSGKKVSVGVNKYIRSDEEHSEIDQSNSRIEINKRREQIGALKKSETYEKALDALSKNHTKLKTPECVDTLIAVASHGATIGDISKSIRRDLPQSVRITSLNIHRRSESLEKSGSDS